ncbi:MurR/RpiR family transcriptional regulator [Limosilactobacillus fermentum]|uniref:MurR/RpiR family transcriptional regulator n=1 Tax=Limosilactobacillus fermentum TaxID=1613 RepID=UPI0020902856|nr:MurR/RpiR family transcriptional regulator [Limosilactobacillus fermentum]UVF13651.1 MurR/RpiR family transcriptional regulator [Limosilactobacillus fermentum]
MNFFDIIGPHLADLTKNEQALFEFVIKNMQKIQGKSIREVSSLAYVSTATFLRFVQKIGFSGYSEFTTVIKFTLINQQQNAKEKLPFTVKQSDYREEYLKNIIEAVRVIQPAKLARVTAKLAEHPEVFFFANGVSKHMTEYLYYLYSMAGFSVHFPRDKDYRRLAIQQVNDDSLVFILSYHGNNDEFVSMINDFIQAGLNPMIVSVTEANNNVIQNMSDLNFYMFTDDIQVNETDITSHISMIAVMELLLYQYVEDHGEDDFNMTRP